VSGQRRYRERDLSWLMSLVMLRETGMSIAEIREVAELERRQDTQRDLLAVFEQHRDRVVQRLDTARRHLRAIEAKIAYFQAVAEQDAEDMPAGRSPCSRPERRRLVSRVLLVRCYQAYCSGAVW